jgi:hypothetical protein
MCQLSEVQGSMIQNISQVIYKNLIKNSKKVPHYNNFTNT